MRECASLNTSVGKDLLSVILPKSAVSRESSLVLCRDGAVSPAEVSFRTWPENSDFSAVYRPNFAGPKGVAFNFESGTLGTGGITIQGDTYTVTYPVFCLMNEAGTAFCTSWPQGKKCLTVYTEREATESLEVVAGVKTVRIQIDSADHFKTLLESVATTFEGVCFNPEAEDKFRASSMAAVLRALIGAD
jgi:hypothetical protein